MTSRRISVTTRATNDALFSSPPEPCVKTFPFTWRGLRAAVAWARECEEDLRVGVDARCNPQSEIAIGEQRASLREIGPAPEWEREDWERRLVWLAMEDLPAWRARVDAWLKRYHSSKGL